MTLKEVRKIKNLTQQDVSDILEIPRRTIEAWESGARKAPDYVMKLIVDRLLNMSREDIVSEKTYCVIRQDIDSDADIVKYGTRRECTEYETLERGKLTKEEQLFKNYRTVKMSEFERELEYNRAVDEYRKSLPDGRKDEIARTGGKEYEKFLLDFHRKFYNRDK